MGYQLRDGRLLVVVHPLMTIERENVTILEEVAYAHHGHTPMRLQLDPSAQEKRDYDLSAEREACWTAGACLIPSRAVERVV